MRVAILVICTGKYSMFWEGFYSSVKNLFLKQAKKTFFVWTDSCFSSREDVRYIYQTKLGWPFDTMYRFKMFNAFAEELSKFDYLFFLNINMLVVGEVGIEIIPNESQNGLMGVLHPGYWNKENHFYPYERRTDSNFYIPSQTGLYYYQGCLNGGKTENFLNMSIILDKMIDEDVMKNIIPIWHDESALNWYYHDKKVLDLSPSYAVPEDANLTIDRKIIQLDKKKYGGHSFLRS